MRRGGEGGRRKKVEIEKAIVRFTSGLWAIVFGGCFLNYNVKCNCIVWNLHHLLTIDVLDQLFHHLPSKLWLGQELSDINMNTSNKQYTSTNTNTNTATDLDIKFGSAGCRRESISWLTVSRSRTIYHSKCIPSRNYSSIWLGVDDISVSQTRLYCSHRLRITLLH